MVSVPNGAAGKPGEGDIDPTDNRQFAYLWDGARLKAGLAEASKVILMTDDDKAGRILRDELAVRLGRSRCWFVTYPSGSKDANDVLVKCGPEALREMIRDAKPMVPDRLVRFSDIPSRADASRYSTGWGGLDPHMMLVAPQFIIVTGKPNHGKSQWTLAVAANTARIHGFKWAILQFEDNPERNRRDLIRYARAWKCQEDSGIYEDPEVSVDRYVSHDCSERRPGSRLRSQVAGRRDRGSRKVSTIVRGVLVDPWNEIEHLWGKRDPEATFFNRALKHLKRLARRFQIFVVIVAHPTAAGGRVASIDEANLYDINGGAVWNNKADVGVIVQADDVALPERHIRVAKSKDYQRIDLPGRRADAVRTSACLV